jgi:hypothetical protein
MKKKILFVLIGLSLLLSVNIFGQRQTAKKIIPETQLALNKGIYLSIEEFLTNNPSIPYNFEVINFNPNYYFYPEERNEYFLTYYDNMGYKKTLAIHEIWGYYNGLGVFLSHRGRPYELLYLGAISILRYHQHYYKSMLAQAISLHMTGSTTTSVEKMEDVFFDLKNDTIVYPRVRNFQKLIENDFELSREFKSDKKTDYYIKPLVYLQKYNDKHPLIITKNGIEFVQEPLNLDVVYE